MAALERNEDATTNGMNLDGPGRMRSADDWIRHVCPVMVGRDDLLGLAIRRLGSAADGRGGTVLLAGEAGVGKTRLLNAIEQLALERGFALLRGSAFTGDTDVAAAPFLDLARSMARTDAFAGTGAALEERLVATGSAADANRRRRLLVLDVVDLLAALATGPLMLAIENVASADELSLEILEGLARRLDRLPMLLVVTYRSDELLPRTPVRAWRARVINDRVAEEVRLDRLGIDGTVAMIELIIGDGQPVARDLVEAVHARTDGIPLHIEEFLGVAMGGARLDGRAMLGADVPDTLDEAIVGRLDRRSPRAQRLAAAAAVIGHAFEAGVLADLTGWSPKTVDDGLNELEAHAFVVPVGGDDRVDFRHALIRDAIYARIPPGERRGLHARFAELAVRQGIEPPGSLAAHFERAGRRDEAFAAAMVAASAAMAISSHREAFAQFERALRNAPDGLPVAELADALAGCADAAAASDDNVRAAEAYALARDRYHEAGDALAAAALMADAVAVQHLLGVSVDARIAILEEALAEVVRLPDESGSLRVRGRLEAMLGAQFMYDLRDQPAIQHVEAARGLAVAAGDEATELHAMATQGSVELLRGNLDVGWHLFEEQIRRARDHRHEAQVARGYRLYGAGGSEVVAYDRAEAAMRAGIEYAERYERWNDRHYMAAHLGLALWATGRWDEATAAARQALADGRGGATTRVTALYVLGYVAAGRGDWSEAREALEESLALGEPLDEMLRTSLPLWGLAETALGSGDPAAAVELCERAFRISARVGDSALLFPFLVTGTRAHLALTDPIAAEAWTDRVADAIRARPIPGALPAIGHARGILLLASGSIGPARSALDTARRGWDDHRRFWEGAWARLDLAACLLRVGRLADAMGLIDDARSAGDRVRSRPLLARADELLQGSRVRRAPEAPWHPLTVREFEVARLIAEGHTNGEVAQRLSIAPKTASAHVEHILAKLGATRRTEIAAWASAIARLNVDRGRPEG